MNKIHKIILMFLVIQLFTNCITEIEPASIDFDDLLVVEGLMTDQSVKHVIKLSRTIPINSKESRPVLNAEVIVETSNQGNIVFFEEEPGIYRSSLPIGATFGTKYRLRIKTADGKEYESSETEMVATPLIDAVTAEFVPKKLDIVGPALKDMGDFNFYLDSRNNETETRSFRYSWTETYKIRIGNPSRWKWLGGSLFEFRREDIPSEQEEFCYRYDSSRSIIVNTSSVTNGEVVKYPIHSFDAETRQMNIRYSIEVVQYGLSPDAEKYWRGLAASSQSQGSLFDIQPGTITANMKSVSDQNETVLGIFEVAQISRYRAFFRPSDFFAQGFGPLTQYWIDCDESEQISTSIPEAGSFMTENSEKYELLYYVTSFAPGGGPAIFGLKRCALCTFYGTNVKPEFWKD